MVYLKVATQKGKDRFREIGKLAMRYIGPYHILERVGEVAYRLELPEDMHLHPMFHVFMLQNHIPDPYAKEPEILEEPQLDLSHPKDPIRIGEQRIRKLKDRELSQVEVFWKKPRRIVMTWEDEDKIRKKYPNLFVE